MSGINKIVLAYSGGLDTSAIIPWLKENYDAEIIAFVADVGQERDDLEGIEQKAIASGAVKCIVKDLREEFVKEYVYPTLKTGAASPSTMSMCSIWHRIPGVPFRWRPCRRKPPPCHWNSSPTGIRPAGW